MLPEHRKDVYRYAKSVAMHDGVENERMDPIEARYEKEALLEFGLCVASAKVFPTIKRAVGYTKSCRLIEIEVRSVTARPSFHRAARETHAGRSICTLGVS